MCGGSTLDPTLYYRWYIQKSPANEINLLSKRERVGKQSVAVHWTSQFFHYIPGDIKMNVTLYLLWKISQIYFKDLVLVHSGCCHRILQSGYLINNRNSFGG